MATLKKIIFILLLLAAAPGQGQYLEIAFTEHPQEKVKDEILKLNGAISDTFDLLQRIQQTKKLMYFNGYLLSSAELDSRDSVTTFTITPGPIIYQGTLRLEWPDDFAIPQEISNPGEVAALNMEGLKLFLEQQLRYLENHGYPFAALQLSHYSFINDTLNGTIQLSPGPLIRIDSISVKGYDRFPQNFMKYDLELYAGMLYDESLLQKIPERTQQIEFLQTTRPPAVAFTKSKTVIYLYMEEVKSNQVDGVIGLNTDEDGEVSFTGDFQLRLLNVLKKGEEFRIRWRRPDEAAQSLDLGFEYPYLFKTPVWFEGDLYIFRQDSSFVNSTISGLLKYLIESGSFLSGGVSYRSSNVLQPEGLPTFTDLSSFSTTFYKLGVELNKANRVIVPTQGFTLQSHGLTGNRKSSGNSQRQYGWQIFGDKYFPFATRHIVKTAVQSEVLFGPDLFQNELFRIGGLKTLRGFNEQSIYSSGYAIGTLEYRYMIGQYDYLTAFADVAFSEMNTRNQYTSNIFTGLGAGLNFRTGAGIFSLFLAVGKDDQNSFDLRTTNVHFGYVNRF